MNAAKSMPVVEGIDADIFLMQEIRKPSVESENCAWFGPEGQVGLQLKVKPGFCVAAEPPAKDVPEHFVPFRVSGKVDLLIFGVWSKRNTEFRYIRGIAKALEIYRSRFEGGRTLVMGDFNSNAIWDNEHPAGMNHSSVARVLQERGLESAYHAFFGEDFGKETRPTFYFHRKPASAYHIDYCFIPREWNASLKTVEVRPFNDVSSISDHRPLIVEVVANGA